MDLQRLFRAKAGITTLHLQVNHDDMRNTLAMQYKVAEGLSDALQHGLSLAASTALPDCLIERAKEASDLLRQRIRNQERNSRLGKVLARRKALLDLHDTLKQIGEHDSKLGDSALRSWLNQLLGSLLCAV